jgi:hypothetical protein
MQWPQNPNLGATDNQRLRGCRWCLKGLPRRNRSAVSKTDRNAAVDTLSELGLIGGEIDTPDELRRNDGDNQALARVDSITGKFGFRVVGPEANQVWLHEHAPRLLQEREGFHKAPPVRPATSVDAFMTKPEVASIFLGLRGWGPPVS